MAKLASSSTMSCAGVFEPCRQASGLRQTIWGKRTWPGNVIVGIVFNQETVDIV